MKLENLIDKLPIQQNLPKKKEKNNVSKPPSIESNSHENHEMNSIGVHKTFSHYNNDKCVKIASSCFLTKRICNWNHRTIW